MRCESGKDVSTDRQAKCSPREREKGKRDYKEDRRVCVSLCVSRRRREHEMREGERDREERESRAGIRTSK